MLRLFAWFSPLAPVVGATLLSWLLVDWVPSSSLALFYMIAVLMVAVKTSVRSALIAAIISFTAYNFFFTYPRFSLYIFHREDLITALTLVFAAVLTGHMAARLKEQLTESKSNTRWTQEFLRFSQHCANLTEESDVIELFEEFLSALLDRAEAPYRRFKSSEIPPQAAESGILKWNKGNCTYVVAAPSARSVHEPFTFEIRSNLDPQFITRLDALFEFVRLSLGRLNLAHQLQEEIAVKEREQLKTALLSSISHDLRTPLATMIGSVSTLIDFKSSLTVEDEQELLSNTLDEARRLDRYIQKLLDMTKVGSGDLKLERDWVGIDEIVGVVLKRTGVLLKGQQIILKLASDLPLVCVHGALIEQAIFNVVENAIRYTPVGKNITIVGQADEDCIELDVCDAGPGIPEPFWNDIFEMFFTLSQGDQHPSGTGLGLAICQSILGAHGGRAKVEMSSPESGTCIRLYIPIRPMGAE